MARGVSYADAVRVLGGRENRTVAALDRLVGGLLLVASATGAGFALSLFDPKSELARLSGDLVSGLAQRLRGVSRLGRSERLAAAHAVIVLTAYFESLREVDLPFDTKELKLTRADQVAIAGGIAGAASVRELADAVLRSDVPMPAAYQPYEQTLETLNGFYERLSDEVTRFVTGLILWDRLNDTQRQRFRDTVCRDVPKRAVARYEELFRQLAADFPEVAFWANLVDHQATRAQIERVSIGLAGVETVLAAISTGQVPDDRRLALARAYQAALQRPILPSGEVPEGLRIPLLAEAYVNPGFRAVQVRMTARLAEEYFWTEEPVRDDLEGFLLGYLTAPHATQTPLLVLGQPGSGKSVLTQVLAARLPPSEFLVLRVILREVPADTDLQAQIEQAIRAATGENMLWAALARSAGDALPVVLLDGFDELLQATGASQSDYLEKIADFQRREADQGRPVVVLVTSRTAVADRARPVAGMVAVRLEPFREEQTAQWLTVWNTVNTSGFAARGVRPLPVESVLAHAELACQPLLLLMLALYDADGNPLQREDAALGQAELYERLLTRFAEREVRKTGTALSAAQFEQAVDRELLRLSVVAFAMFNRARQWVTEAELDADLPALLGEPGNRQHPSGLRAELTASELVIGRFFFIHDAQAIRDSTRLKTYEFLHATFGEYLIARLVTRELADLVDTATRSATRSRPTPPDDAFLHALLSFAPLTLRGTVVSFLSERLQMPPETGRDLLRDLLLTLFHHSLLPRHDTSYDGYEPDQISVPARHAFYSVNLVLLAVLTAGEITERQLFPDRVEPVRGWRRITLLWRSQLPEESWENLIRTLDLHRGWDGDRRTLHLCIRDKAKPYIAVSDPYWTYNFGEGDEYRRRGGWFSWVHDDHEVMYMQSHFLCEPKDDIVAHALELFSGDLGTMLTTFHDFWQGRPVSAANALITLWLTATQEKGPEELATAYDACIKIAISGFAPQDIDTRKRFRAHVLRQLATDFHRLPPSWLDDTIKQIKEAGKSEYKDGSELAQMANEILPELMAEDPPQSL